MTTRTKFWLKVVMTALFVDVEVFTISYSVLPAFEHLSVRNGMRAFGTQICFVLALLFLWLGERTRIFGDVGWGSLAMATLILGLI